jgi:predicted nucleic acid-binding Zn ribbon protein
MYKCPNCGKEVPLENDFCSNECEESMRNRPTKEELADKENEKVNQFDW